MINFFFFVNESQATKWYKGGDFFFLSNFGKSLFHLTACTSSSKVRAGILNGNLEAGSLLASAPGFALLAFYLFVCILCMSALHVYLHATKIHLVFFYQLHGKSCPLGMCFGTDW